MNMSQNMANTLPYFVAVVIALIIGCIFMVRSIQRKRRFRDSKPLEVLTETEWTYEMHEKKAYELESSGEYSQATRHLFLAILLFFDEKGWLVAKRWKTNWEYYDELVRTRKLKRELLDLYKRGYSLEGIAKEKRLPVDEVEKKLNPYIRQVHEGGKVVNGA